MENDIINNEQLPVEETTSNAIPLGNDLEPIPAQIVGFDLTSEPVVEVDEFEFNDIIINDEGVISASSPSMFKETSIQNVPSASLFITELLKFKPVDICQSDAYSRIMISRYNLIKFIPNDAQDKPWGLEASNINQEILTNMFQELYNFIKNNSITE